MTSMINTNLFSILLIFRYHKIQTTVLNNHRSTNGTVTKTKRLLGYVKSLLYMLVVLVV